MKRNRQPFKSLIERTISKLAQDESGKRQHYRPVYSLHKWWARRSGAQFRSIILLAAGLDDGLFEIDETGGLLESSKYFHPPNLERLIVFDPFMGGGTTLVEANRLGAKVIGCDINPVSYWIVRESLRPIDLQQLSSIFDNLNETVGESIREIYRTDCVVCGRKNCEGLHVFWIREIICPKCSKQVPLYKRTLLNKGLKRNKPISEENKASIFCANCFSLNTWEGSGICTCNACNAEFDPMKGTFDHGRFCCPNCGEAGQKLAEVAGNSRLMTERIVAIEYWCPSCKKRLYKSPDSKDYSRIKEIERQFRETKEDMTLPHQSIPKGSSSRRWRTHGYRYYSQIFSSRQLLALNFVEQSLGKTSYEYRDAFVTILSNSLEYNNMMTPYNYPHRKLHHLFTYHSFPLTTTPVENSFWGSANMGAGTFVNCYQRYLKAKLYCRRPFEKYKDASGRIRTVFTPTERIEAKFVDTFQHLTKEKRGAMLFCRDSSHVPEIPDNSVDLVITDPPYFDNVHYSELSNFFYVWLRLLIENEYFEEKYVSPENEAVVNLGMGKDSKKYQQIMVSVFKECRRVLKEEGTLAFTFHHSKLQAWWAILCALRESGFSINTSFPVNSEYKMNPHIRQKDTLDMDLVLFCKPRLDILTSLSTPAQLLERALRFALDSNMARTRKEAVIRFIGNILRIASSSNIQYDWFAGAMKQLERELDLNISKKGVISFNHLHKRLHKGN
ncbi:MAG: DUF1156 domain-containing protein [Candidatus Thorarchaeota archaeon]|nr:DUF1156 domain-containing protein [Candidatus Thorarchaeota archaeon]